MKAGEIVTFAHAPDDTVTKIPTSPLTERHTQIHALQHFGTHSDEDWGKSDATKPVEAGRADYVIVCKVIAVVRRSARVEE